MEKNTFAGATTHVGGGDFYLGWVGHGLPLYLVSWFATNAAGSRLSLTNVQNVLTSFVLIL
jgi:hypothetical protein